MQQRCPVLIVAHPGHELRVHGWMEQVRPTVCVLTDGSGSTGEGRIQSTTRLLERINARIGPVFGIMSDRAIYSAIMDGDRDTFRRIADRLCEAMVAAETDCVVGDAVEGYNPSHDVCRLVINAAVRMASSVRGKEIPSYDFALVGPSGECPEHLEPTALRIALDDAALERKIEAANNYPEIVLEVEAAVERFGVAPFRMECLRPVDVTNWLGWTCEEIPFYEVYGEKRVAEGAYDRVLRFEEHFYPIAEALRDHSTVS